MCSFNFQNKRTLLLGAPGVKSWSGKYSTTEYIVKIFSLLYKIDFVFNVSGTVIELDLRNLATHTEVLDKSDDFSKNYYAYLGEHCKNTIIRLSLALSVYNTCFVILLMLYLFFRLCCDVRCIFLIKE